MQTVLTKLGNDLQKKYQRLNNTVYTFVTYHKIQYNYNIIYLYELYVFNICFMDINDIVFLYSVIHGLVANFILFTTFRYDF